MGLHDVNVKMAIMDKLMSFFMICYLVMWLQRNEGVLWFMRCCFLLVAFSGIGGGIHAQINGVLLGYQRGQYRLTQLEVNILRQAFV